MPGSVEKRRVSSALERSLVNPLVRLAFRMGVPTSGDALLETIGRSTGNERVTPVCDGLDGETFWVIAADGRQADWVQDIEANPSVRIQVHGEWHRGMAQILDDDDPRERERILGRGNIARQLCLRTSRATSTDLLTIRVDLQSVERRQAE
jgi:deazaflavin-dependent oxidoreductase (nitroreductase family)